MRGGATQPMWDEEQFKADARNHLSPFHLLSAYLFLKPKLNKQNTGSPHHTVCAKTAFAFNEIQTNILAHGYSVITLQLKVREVVFWGTAVVCVVN